MSYKRLIPCIFIKDGKAVRWIDDPTVVSKDVIELAKYYSDHGADELIVLDLSDSDEEHDETITLMKRINRVIRIPMIAGGNIRRQEDIKKILYTGAKRAMLNFSKPDNMGIRDSMETGWFQTGYPWRAHLLYAGRASGCERNPFLKNRTAAWRTEEEPF